jgi:hypothetical protein
MKVFEKKIAEGPARCASEIMELVYRRELKRLREGPVFEVAGRNIYLSF